MLGKFVHRRYFFFVHKKSHGGFRHKEGYRKTIRLNLFPVPDILKKIGDGISKFWTVVQDKVSQFVGQGESSAKRILGSINFNQRSLFFFQTEFTTDGKRGIVHDGDFHPSGDFVNIDRDD